MTFSELLKQPILLAETIRVSRPGVSKNESCFIQDGDFIAIFKLAILVSPDNGIIYKGAIAGQIFHNCDRIAVLVFAEY
jgi:hypothetical protein